LGGSEVGTVDTVLSEEDLNQAITFDRTEIRNLRIHPEPGHLRITLEYHTIVAWVPVTVTTRLRIVDGHAIYFSSPAITAVSVSLPQAVSDYIIKRVQALNPIFDLNRLDLPMDVDLTAAESVQGRLLVHGTIRIPDY
jgi:hypothetical protein